MNEKQSKKTLENNIQYYHMQLNNFISLVKLRKWDEFKEQKETIIKIINDYRESFKNDPKYSETLPSMAEYFLSN